MEKNIFTRVYLFYYNGFRNMSGWGKQAWLIILIKLFIMFVVMRLFFFPNYLNSNFDSDEQRSEHVLDQLTNPK